MVTIYTGRAGCGKTQALLSAMGEGAKAGRRQLLIVPEMLSHESERRLLQSQGNPIARFAEVLTFKRLAQRVLGEGGHPPALLDGGGRVLAMHRALSLCGDSLTHFSLSARPELAGGMLELVSELKSCQVAPEDLAKAAESLGESRSKVRDLSLCYAAYQSVTKDLPLDDKDLLTACREALVPSDFGRGWDLYFDGFSGMTAQERSIVEVLLEKCHSAAFALLWEKDDRLFLEQEKFLQRLAGICQKINRPLKVCPLKRKEGDLPPALSVLERDLFDYAAAPTENAWQGVKLYSLSDPQEECEFAASLCRKAMGEGMRCRNMVVACSDMETYAPLLESAFQKWQVPLFLGEKSDILQKPVMAAQQGALLAACQGMGYEDVFAYLKSGLSPLTMEECDKLENYVLMHNIRGKQYFAPFRKNPGGYGAKEDPGALLELEHIRQKIAPAFENLTQALKVSRQGPDYAQALERFLQETGMEQALSEKARSLEEQGRARESAEYSQLYDILQGALCQFSAAMDGQQMDAGEFCRLWRLMLSQYQVAAIPVSLDHVQAASFDRQSFAGVEFLIILGAREGALPPAVGGGSLLTEEERDQLLRAGVTLTQTAEEQAYEAQSQIYHAFAAPHRSLAVLCPQTLSGGTVCRPSYLVERMLHLLPGLEMSRPTGDFRLLAPRPAWELACAACQGEGDIWARAALSLEEEKGEAEQNHFEALRRYAVSPRGPIRSRELVAAAYGKRIRITASRAEKVAACRFSYFMEYGLHAKERKRATFGAPETGTFLHEVVERAVRLLEEGEEQEPRKAALRAIAQVKEKTLPHLEEESPRFRAIFRRIQRMVVSIVEDVWQELSLSKFRPIAFEMAFGPGEEYPPILLEGDGVSLTLSGKIDRLDGFIQDGTLYVKVADYKTGKKTFHLSDLLYGINMQMFVYLLMVGFGREAVLEKARERLGDGAQQIQTAGVLYIPAKTPYVQVGYGEDGEGKLTKELRRIGIVLDEEPILQAMEDRQEGDFRFLPVSVKKGGGLKSTSSVTSREGLEKLTRGVDRQLRRLCALITRGDIEAQPLVTGPGASVCNFCPYKDACHYDETMAKDAPQLARVLSQEEVYARLTEEEEEETHHGR